MSTRANKQFGPDVDVQVDYYRPSAGCTITIERPEERDGWSKAWAVAELSQEETLALIKHLLTPYETCSECQAPTLWSQIEDLLKDIRLVKDNA